LAAVFDERGMVVKQSTGSSAPKVDAAIAAGYAYLAMTDAIANRPRTKGNRTAFVGNVGP
jgi:hypothetical protein